MKDQCHRLSFVLKKALELNLPVNCCVLTRLTDRNARPEEVIDEVLELFLLS